MDEDFSFDPIYYDSPWTQAELLTEALLSGDSVFVSAALKFALSARGLNGKLVGVDPRLSLVMSSLDALGLDLIPVMKGS